MVQIKNQAWTLEILKCSLISDGTLPSTPPSFAYPQEGCQPIIANLAPSPFLSAICLYLVIQVGAWKAHTVSYMSSVLSKNTTPGLQNNKILVARMFWSEHIIVGGGDISVNKQDEFPSKVAGWDNENAWWFSSAGAAFDNSETSWCGLWRHNDYASVFPLTMLSS